MPQNEEIECLRKQRQNEVKENKKIYRWVPPHKNTFKGFPRYGDYETYPKLPLLFQRHTIRHRDFKEHTLEGIIDISIESIRCKKDFKVNFQSNIESFLITINHLKHFLMNFLFEIFFRCRFS